MARKSDIVDGLASDVEGLSKRQAGEAFDIIFDKITDELASYSNFGPEIQIAAPGGDFEDPNDYSFILSTYNSGDASYAWLAGTSMASTARMRMMSRLVVRFGTSAPAEPGSAASSRCSSTSSSNSASASARLFASLVAFTIMLSFSDMASEQPL